MANFGIETVETLDYDFTPFDSETSKGKCKGKGTIPEPTQAKIEAYGVGVRKLFGMDLSKEEIAKEIDDISGEERTEKLYALTSALCGGSPTKAQIVELPPRIRNAFFKWIFKEIQDPEV